MWIPPHTSWAKLDKEKRLKAFLQTTLNSFSSHIICIKSIVSDVIVIRPSLSFSFWFDIRSVISDFWHGWTFFCDVILYFPYLLHPQCFRNFSPTIIRIRIILQTPTMSTFLCTSFLILFATHRFLTFTYNTQFP